MSDSKYVTKSEFYNAIGAVFFIIGLYYILPKYGEHGDTFLGSMKSSYFIIVPMGYSIYLFARGRKERRKTENI